jgi:hypothetical protein
MKPNVAKVLENRNRASDIVFNRGTEKGDGSLEWIRANIINHPEVRTTLDAVKRIRKSFDQLTLEEAAVLAEVAKYGLPLVACSYCGCKVVPGENCVECDTFCPVDDKERKTQSDGIIRAILTLKGE